MTAYSLTDGKWHKHVTWTDEHTGKENSEWVHCTITAVPVDVLLNEWDTLLLELSMKEIKLHNLKEDIFLKEQSIIRETDFNDLYGKNNKDVRKEHLDKVMKEDYLEKVKLEFSIHYLKRYMVLLKEVIRSKV